MLSLDEALARARSVLDRVTVEELPRALEAGALLVDIRPVGLRDRDGEHPDAVVIDRNVLEWRLASTSADRLPDLDPARPVILMCDEGYQSSLAAAALKELGVDATDLDGGFQAYLAVRTE